MALGKKAKEAIAGADALRDRATGMVGTDHGDIAEIGSTFMVTDDGVNGSVTFTPSGIERVSKKLIGRNDRQFIPYQNIGSVSHNRKITGRDRVKVFIAGQEFEWKIARDAEKFVNTLQAAIVAGAYPAGANPGAAPQPPAPAPAPPSAQPAAGGGASALGVKLAELAQLHEQGILTDDEFSSAKQRAIEGSYDS